MDIINTFENGFNTQVDPMEQPTGTYLKAVNFLRNEAGSPYVNRGAKTLTIAGLDGYMLNGHIILNDQAILILTNSTGSTSVGHLSSNDIYTEVLNTTAFGYTVDSVVDLEAKVNYKGERLIYFCDGENTVRYLNMDNVPAEDVDANTSLFLDYDLPNVEFSEVVSGGSVTSGIYQATARLVTGSLNKTSVGFISGVVPIVNEDVTVGNKDYDGAPPQTATGQAITFTIKNIDPNFEYIEPIMVTYVGNSNQLKVRSLSRIPINGRTEISFTYSGPDDEVDTVTETEVAINAVKYASAKYITQKDGHLLLSGMVEDVNNDDWQEWANSVRLKYVIKETSVTEDIDIQNEDNEPWVQEFRGATISEVWSDVGTSYQIDNDYNNPEFTEKFKGYRRGEVYSFTITPIFAGGRLGDAYHIPGEFNVDTEANTSTNKLGSALVSDYKYPAEYGALENKYVRYHKMPTVAQEPFVVQSGNSDIVRILGVEAEITMDESLWKNKIIGYIIGRENRTGKETILSQGLAKSMYTMDGDVKGMVPSFGNMKIKGVSSESNMDTDKYDKRLFTYHAPDLVVDSGSAFVPSKIERVMQMDAQFAFGNFGGSHNRFIHNFVNCRPGTATSDIVDLYKGYTKLPTEVLDSENEDDRTGGADYSKTINLGGTESVRYRRILECLAMKSLADLPRNYDLIDQWEDNGPGDDETYKFLTTDRFTIDLYNIHTERRNYYGDVYGKTSYPVSVTLFSQGNVDPDSGEVLADNLCRFFNGDTFISKYAHVYKDTMSGSYGGIGGDYQHVARANSMVYFYLESRNNYNYRHYTVADGESVGSLPYYPKYRLVHSREDTLGILNYPARFGHSTGYNAQYSAQSLLQPMFSKELGQEVISEFGNRSVYSAQSIEGERFDAFRLFLPNDYHDIPKQYGKITGSFVHNGELHFHTEQALWKSFFNSLVTQSSSAGEIVLGTGGAFPRPSIPLMTVEGGYAGCLNNRASVGTPNGRYFIDSSKGKLFHYTDGIREISNPLLFDEFRKFVNNETILGYDYTKKRLTVSNINDKTLTFSPELQSFDGYQSYVADTIISFQKRTLIANGNSIAVLHEGDPCNFFGVVTNAQLGFSVKHSEYTNLRFSAFDISSLTKTIDGHVVPFDTVDMIRFYTQSRSTGWNNVNIDPDGFDFFPELGTVLVHRVNDVYRGTIPPDVVYDITRDINDPTNHVTDGRFTDDDRLFIPEMTGNYMIVELEFKPEVGKFVRINSFKTKVHSNKL